MRNVDKLVETDKTYVKPQLLRTRVTVERKHNLRKASLNNAAPYEHQRLWVNHGLVYFNQAGSYLLFPVFSQTNTWFRLFHPIKCCKKRVTLYHLRPSFHGPLPSLYVTRAPTLGVSAQRGKQKGEQFRPGT